MIFEKKMEQFYRKQLCTRQDNPYGIHYFSPGDFPGLQAHPYTFPSQLGHDLKGWFYHYDKPIPGRLVVFDHGMGNGHRAYMREIETLCKDGWLVFSYDHTGCMTSGGTDIRGFAQSLADLDDCIRALKKEKALSGRTLSVIGHSWGGFSAMNIGALHPEITHIIGMSGFVSVERIIRQTFSGFMKLYVKAILESELRTSPRYGRFNALESLQKTKAKVLLIYAEDDKTVHKAMHYDPLHQALAGKDNVEFLLLTDGKNHNPTYTAEAVKYKDAFFAEFQKAVKEKQLQTPEEQSEFMRRYDWYAMTVQDMAVWNRIFDHLRK